MKLKATLLFAISASVLVLPVQAKKLKFGYEAPRSDIQHVVELASIYMIQLNVVTDIQHNVGA